MRCINELAFSNFSSNSLVLCNVNSKYNYHIIVDTISVRPELRLQVNAVDQFPVPTFKSGMKQISISCAAYGSKPKVMIQLKIGDANWESPSILNVVSRDMLYDTTAVIHYNISEIAESVVIHCRTSGQETIPSVNMSTIWCKWSNRGDLLPGCRALVSELQEWLWITQSF